MTHRLSIVRSRRRAPGAARAARRGMTLVEIIVAMALLVGVVLVLGGFSTKFAQANSQVHLVISANEIAAQRLDEVRQVASYGAIDQLAESTAVKYDFLDYSRKTLVKRTVNAAPDSADYKVITVTVKAPGMRKTVTKSTAIAAF